MFPGLKLFLNGEQDVELMKDMVPAGQAVQDVELDRAENVLAGQNWHDPPELKVPGLHGTH
jgi:hypothetical protein